MWRKRIPSFELRNNSAYFSLRKISKNGLWWERRRKESRGKKSTHRERREQRRGKNECTLAAAYFRLCAKRNTPSSSTLPEISARDTFSARLSTRPSVALVLRIQLIFLLFFSSLVVMLVFYFYHDAQNGPRVKCYNQFSRETTTRGTVMKFLSDTRRFIGVKQATSAVGFFQVGRREELIFLIILNKITQAFFFYRTRFPSVVLSMDVLYWFFIPTYVLSDVENSL